MKRILIFAFAVSLFFPPATLHAEDFHTTGVIREFDILEQDGFTEEVATVELADGRVVEAMYGAAETESGLSNLFSVGQKVVVVELDSETGDTLFVITDPYRIPAIIGAVIGFFVLIFVIGKMRGVTSLLGLVLSIAIIVFFIVPKIADGASPLVVALIGATLIAVLSITTAHGFSRRTMVALSATLCTLMIATILSSIAVNVTHLFGLGNEDAYILQFGQFSQINFEGLLLAGIIIGALGVLDDVTTAQVAAVDEIHKANPALSKKDLLQRSFSVGKEHLTSMVNTLALAYAGASLPLLLAFSVSGVPAWALINGELISEEIIRTVIGSASLVLAVPISTRFAVHFLAGKQTSEAVDKASLD